ncbi:MAG: hypothetical protein M3156_01760 [Thermoproteota archaeon]|nr:hypothetical protein [Thermoproteota archaeon]
MVNVKKKLLFVKMIAKSAIKRLKCTFTRREWDLITIVQCKILVFLLTGVSIELLS